MTSSDPDSPLIGLRLSLTAFAQDRGTVEEIASRTDAMLSYPRRGGATARLCSFEGQVASAADLDIAAERFADRAAEVLQATPESALRADDLVLDISITLFPNGSINAGLFIPRSLLTVAVQYEADLYFNAY